MKIDEQHIAEPGLVALDITAADEDTVRTVIDGLQQQCATGPPTSTRCRSPGPRSTGSSCARSRWPGSFRARRVGSRAPAGRRTRL
ncbi:DUF6207 family protein [Streptomyces sp. NBC_00846]|nr:DUF6207 family protein [Streptomyces sp. NBC_00846]